jgi:hypothetical protein
MTEDSEAALHGHVDLRFFFLFSSKKRDDEQKRRHARKRFCHSRHSLLSGIRCAVARPS